MYWDYRAQVKNFDKFYTEQFEDFVRNHPDYARFLNNQTTTLMYNVNYSSIMVFNTDYGINLYSLYNRSYNEEINKQTEQLAIELDNFFKNIKFPHK